MHWNTNTCKQNSYINTHTHTCTHAHMYNTYTYTHSLALAFVRSLVLALALSLALARECLHVLYFFLFVSYTHTQRAGTTRCGETRTIRPQRRCALFWRIFRDCCKRAGTWNSVPQARGCWSVSVCISVSLGCVREREDLWNIVHRSAIVFLQLGVLCSRLVNEWRSLAHSVEMRPDLHWCYCT